MKKMHLLTTFWIFLSCATITLGFVARNIHQSPPQQRYSRTKLYMVFDFFKKRSEEGLEQLEKLSSAASKGQLGAGLKDVAAYTRETNQAFASGLAKSRNRLLANLESIYTGSDDALEDFQDTLLQADLGTATADDIVNEVKSLREDSTKFLSRNDLMSVMRGKLIEILNSGTGAINFADEGDKYPTVIFIMGANGMGKTTTIGKLAHRLRIEGNQTVLMAACDTFRAGAVEQLEQWAERAEVDIFVPSEIAKSPAAVLYGALDKADAGNYDTLLVDTSGRLSNNDALTAELVKMKNVIKKRYSVKNDEDGKPIPNENVPHESLLVLDAAQGRMALDSAKVWDKEVGLTGLILTKLDGSARGGSVVAVSRELNLPVKLIGVGEGIDDLRDFEPELFVDGLLGIGAAGGKSGKSEGAMLASRLESLRKERAQRAPEIKSKKRETISSGGNPVPSSPGTAPIPQKSGKRKNNRKKGKR